MAATVAAPGPNFGVDQAFPDSTSNRLMTAPSYLTVISATHRFILPDSGPATDQPHPKSRGFYAWGGTLLNAVHVMRTIKTSPKITCGSRFTATMRNPKTTVSRLAE